MIKTESKNAKALHEGRAFSYELVNAYHQKFIDPKTGRFDTRYTEHRVCPVCGADQPLKAFDSSGGTYVSCEACTMVYLDPVFKDEHLKMYYRDLNTGQAAITANESAFHREIYSMGLSAIATHQKPGTILDIGCSSGFFLDVAREKGWSTNGIELGLAEAELCRKKGHVLYTQDVRDLKLNTKFDAITMWDVFEHIPDGQGQLNFMRSLIKDGGVLFLQIPNAGGLAPRLMQAKCRMFDGVEHVNLYNPDTIRVISEIAVMNNYLSYQDPYFGQSPYGGEKFLGAIPAETLHQNLWGYKMQVVLRKA